LVNTISIDSFSSEKSEWWESNLRYVGPEATWRRLRNDLSAVQQCQTCDHPISKLLFEWNFLFEQNNSRTAQVPLNYEYL